MRVSPNVVTYNALIYGFCIASQLREAVSILNQMALKNITPNIYTFNILVDARKESQKRQKNVLLWW